MNDPTCSMCIYFCQHYIPWRGGVFIPVEYGHCIYDRVKMCRSCRKACIHFLLRTEPQ